MLARGVRHRAPTRGGLPHVIVRERTVEASGGFGEFVWRQAEFASGRGDHLRRDVATAKIVAYSAVDLRRARIRCEIMVE